MFSRIKNYGLNRLQDSHLRRDTQGFMRDKGRRAADAIRPIKLTKDDFLGAFYGRYEDDGRSRFREMVRDQGLTKETLNHVLARHRRDFIVSLIIASCCAVLAVAFILNGSSGFNLLGSLVFGIFMFGFAIKAFGADYAAFQIRHRKFCSLRTYLRDGFFSPS